MADNKIVITASLDFAISATNIRNDLKNIADKINADKAFKVIVNADLGKTQTRIQSQLNTISKNLKLDVGNINVGNVNTRNIVGGLQSVQRQAQQTAENVDNVSSQISGFATAFNQTSNAVNKAEQEFREFFNITNKGDVTGSWTKSMDGSIDGFIINVKKAKGETESFKYTLKEIEGEMQFIYSGGRGSDAGIYKLDSQIQKTFADYTQKLAQFKSTNANILSGLTQPLAEFETKLEGLKNGTVGIDEVQNSFKVLGTEASKIMANLTGQLNKSDAAVRKYLSGDEIISGLQAEIKGLDNTPKELVSDLNNVTKLLQNIRKIEAQEGRTANWSAEYRKWSDELDKIKAKLKVIKKQQTNNASTQVFSTRDLKKAEIPYMTKVSNTIESQMAEIQKMANAKGWQDFKVKGIEQANGQIKSLTLTVRDASGALKEFTMQRAKLDTGKHKRSGLMQMGDVKILESASEYQKTLNKETEKYQNEIDGAIKRLNNLNNNTAFRNNSANANVQVQRQNIQNLITQYEILKTQLQGTISPEGLKQIESILATLKSQFDVVQNECTELKISLNSNSALNKFGQDVEILKNRIITLKNANGKSIKDFGRDFNSLFASVDALRTSFSQGQIDIQGLNAANRQLKILEGNIINANKSGHKLFKTLAEQAKKFSSWMSLTYVISSFARSVRNAISELKEIDSILTEISKTSERTDESLSKLGETSFDSASKYGKKASDYLLGVQEMSRAGFGEKESEVMAELSVMAQSAGDMNAELANSYIIATDAAYGFGGSAEKLNSVLDSQNFITNRNALNLSELAEATKIVSSQASQAGIGIDEMTAAVGTMIATTQQGGEVASRSFKGRRTICTIALYGCKSIAA